MVSVSEIEILTKEIQRDLEITLFFPVYNDELTVERVVRKSLDILDQITDTYEVIVIDDGSPDRSGEIADQLAQQFDKVRVVHHQSNKGYGAALQTGFKESRYDWICFTDGDDEYDVFDLLKLVRLIDYYALIITFRYARLYSTKRIFISRTYNKILSFLFNTNYRDISTGLRMVRKDVIEEINLTSNSPFIGAELTIKTMLKGYPVGEVGIQTFPREFGKGASTSMKNILKTIKDMFRVRQEIFSSSYDLPPNREYMNRRTK